MPKGSDTLDVQSNCHIYFPAKRETRINCTWLSCCCVYGQGQDLPALKCDSIHTPELTELPNVSEGSGLSPCVSTWAGHVTTLNHSHLHPPLHPSCLHVLSTPSRAALAPADNKGAAAGLVLSCQSRSGHSVWSSAEPHPAQRALLPPGC